MSVYVRLCVYVCVSVCVCGVKDEHHPDRLHPSFLPSTITSLPVRQIANEDLVFAVYNCNACNPPPGEDKHSLFALARLMVDESYICIFPAGLMACNMI